jgi:hypothetical protein
VGILSLKSWNSYSQYVDKGSTPSLNMPAIRTRKIQTILFTQFPILERIKKSKSFS